MPPKRPSPSEGVQIRLDSTLKQQARHQLTQAQMTWQDLLEPCIRQFVAARRAPAVGTTSAGSPDLPSSPQAAVILDLTTLLPPGHSLELPLGNAAYRRWIHHCTRCQRLWVAELATPQKCVHCKSPSWQTPPTRQTQAKAMD